MDIRLDSEDGFDQPVERSGVAGNFSFKFQSFTHGHNRNAVNGDGTVDKNFIANLRAFGIDVNSGLNRADAGGVDENLVAFAAVDDLGVAGDEQDISLSRRAFHRLDDAHKSSMHRPASRMKPTERFFLTDPNIIGPGQRSAGCRVQMTFHFATNIVWLANQPHV